MSAPSLIRLLDRYGRHARSLGLLLAILLCLGLLAVLSPKYIRGENFIVVALQMSFVGIVAVGMSMLMIGGNVDLSIGSLYALCAVTAAILAKSWPAPAAMAAGVFCGGLVGWINGLFVHRMRLSPLIITLGSMSVLRGVVLLLTGGYSVRDVPKAFNSLGQIRPLGLPMPVLALIASALACHLVLTRTTIGRHIIAMGSSRAACEAVGVRTRRLMLGSFAVNGLITGLAGVLAASRFGSASPSFGAGLELDVITAVVLGGVAFTGGEGNIPGVMLAVALMGLINSGIVALGFDPFWADVAKGAALIAAVSIDQLSHEARDRFRKKLAMQERDNVTS
jgi:ribose transport system permease protein